MKRPDSTEMDRLLRRYGRRGGEALRGANGEDSGVSSSSPHMDADELSAYAEGAMPEGARSRYVAHLADCDTCRKLVTDLVLATGLVNREESIKPPTIASTTRSWREWLAAIFSPPVLRYAVPALALLAVIVVVAVVATRDRREPASVAQNEQTFKDSAQPTGAASNSSAPNSVETAPDLNANSRNANVQSNTGVITAPVPEVDGKAGQEERPVKTEAGEKDAKATTTATKPADGTVSGPGQFGSSSAGASAAKEPPRINEVEPAAAPPAPAPTPAPVLATQTAREVGGRDSVEEQRKAKASSDDDNERTRVESNKVAGGAIRDSKADRQPRKRAEGTNNAPSAQGLPMTTGRAATPGNRSVDATDEREDKSAPTRSVGGRRFRRQGGAWVDTEYTSSLSTTHVRRGSEQYRSLVADEPGLRTITQQLSGEVIVVWGRRAYRFY